MATEFLRERINMIVQLTQAEVLNIEQHELLIKASEKGSGDAQVDRVMVGNAQNARAVVLASQRRLQTYKDRLDELTKELKTSE